MYMYKLLNGVLGKLSLFYQKKKNNNNIDCCIQTFAQTLGDKIP